MANRHEGPKVIQKNIPEPNRPRSKFVQRYECGCGRWMERQVPPALAGKVLRYECTTCRRRRERKERKK